MSEAMHERNQELCPCALLTGLAALVAPDVLIVRHCVAVFIAGPAAAGANPNTKSKISFSILAGRRMSRFCPVHCHFIACTYFEPAGVDGKQRRACRPYPYTQVHAHAMQGRPGGEPFARSQIETNWVGRDPAYLSHSELENCSAWAAATRLLARLRCRIRWRYRLFCASVQTTGAAGENMAMGGSGEVKGSIRLVRFLGMTHGSPS